MRSNVRGVEELGPNFPSSAAYGAARGAYSGSFTQATSHQATDFCVRRQWGEEKIRHLFEQMDAYKANTQDYQRSLAPGADPDEWVSPPEDEEFKPKEVKDPGPSKQRSKVDDTDMGPLEVSDLDLYRACNPAPSAQQSATRTEEELEASLTAARELEAEEDMRFVANAETFTQMMLNIELEYDLASPIWEGEYVTMDTAPEIPALGQEDDAVPLDVDTSISML
ncbi:hypothetical protein WJX77_002773 [Trebouxia sp. C0004]